ncbi:lysosomal alpha-glucosidase-like [Amblyomma americanum]
MARIRRKHYHRLHYEPRKPRLGDYVRAIPVEAHVCILVTALVVSVILWLNIEGSHLDPDSGAIGPRPCNSHSRACTSVDAAARFDCHPDPGLSRASCEWRGCCYLQNASNEGGPACYFPTGYVGYKMTHWKDSPSGVSLSHMTRVRPSGLPEDASQINVRAALHTSQIARLTVTSPEDIYRTNVPTVPEKREPASQALGVYTTRMGDVVVYRRSDGQILFETDIARLVYTPRLVQLVTLVPTMHLYGFGEGRGRLLRDITQPHAAFNRDLLALNDTRYLFHGSHPFYMGFDRMGASFGVYFRTSAIYEVLGHSMPALTFRSLGSQVDVFVLGGPTPADVVRQYLDVVGRPAMPPLWATGLHASMPRVPPPTMEEGNHLVPLLSRGNYRVDVAWMPVDITREKCEYTRYFEMSFLRPSLRVVHTLVPTLTEQSPSSPICFLALMEAKYLGITLHNQTQESLEEQVPAGNITGHIVDFSAPRYDMYLSKVLKALYLRSPMDGLWLDNNEPTLWTGEPPGGCAMDGWDILPYTPKVLLSEGPLDSGTLCMSQQLGSGPHLLAHNALPYEQAQAAYGVLAQLSGERPFIVSRASYSGIGKFAGHVIHGLRPTWEDLRLSVPMLLTASLLGMPLSGAELCGDGFTLSSPADQELCVTWFSLAVFYPLLRTSNGELFLRQPPAFSTAFLSETLDMLDVRFLLRPYLYYLFHRSHVAGDTVMRPLFIEFPSDTETRNIDDQFLWGSGLMIIPILKPLTQKSRLRRAYLPEGTWYNFYNGALVRSSLYGEYWHLYHGSHRVLLLLRGGHVLVTSAPPPFAISPGQGMDYSLRVVLDDNLQAKGSVYCDDGVSLGSYENGAYGLADVIFHKDTLVVVPRHTGFACGVVRELRFVGLRSGPELTTLDGVPLHFTTHGNQTVISNLALPLNETSVLRFQLKNLQTALAPGTRNSTGL